MIKFTFVLLLNLIFNYTFYKDIQPILNQYECSQCHIGEQGSS